MTYMPKTYKTDDGDRQVIASGGSIDIESGGVIKAAGTQAGTIADAKVDYATPDLDTEAEIIVAINATNTTLNAVVAALKGAGIIASS